MNQPLMPRRVLLAAITASPLAFARRKPRVAVMPVDSARMNAFAAAFNAFTEDLRQGKADVKAWEAVVSAWAAMTA